MSRKLLTDGDGVEFRTVTDRLMKDARITAAEIAEACGVSRNLIERARMEGAGSRTPPAGWEAALAELARTRGAELQELAGELEEAAK